MCHTRLRNADLGESVHSIGPKKMADSFDDMIISVWRQALIERRLSNWRANAFEQRGTALAKALTDYVRDARSHVLKYQGCVR